ncbi:CRISPR-associated Cse3 family protein [Murinocardiopsis flavida]|uniref:CRISPR-associated Cse3 family protein n=1 Tax=Murinocardiopsis flavida TaxID=645275 RepID=A0A2P8CAA8_9ACTN|nr:type I-E CRISPR-associated protein Cas6/Cse3/CasE [Murinocardiopsis flavida]PSK81891.1 CRISPR-associated Cse3 family protein [Murinocardiopsis flavida]
MNAWLTQITLNHRHRRSHELAADANLLHRELMRLAPDDLGETPRSAAGLLYRMEESRTGLRILAQTRTRPRVDRLSDGLANDVTSRDLTPLLTGLRPGAYVRYRIAANPTQRVGDPKADPRRKGKLTVVTGERGDLWWLTRATANGLHPLSLTQTRLSDTRAGMVAHAVTRFDGLAIITDTALLRDAVLTGIGRAKSYGCGLLSLGPARKPE